MKKNKNWVGLTITTAYQLLYWSVVVFVIMPRARKIQIEAIAFLIMIACSIVSVYSGRYVMKIVNTISLLKMMGGGEYDKKKY